MKLWKIVQAFFFVPWVFVVTVCILVFAVFGTLFSVVVASFSKTKECPNCEEVTGSDSTHCANCGLPF